MKLNIAVLVIAALHLICSSSAAPSTPTTLASLSGSWELRTACMNEHGKQGACIEMKPGSLRFTFATDGRWSSAANDPNKTRKNGTHQVQGNRLILKNPDGSVYQNWQADLNEDRQHLVVIDKQLIETFERVKATDSTLE